MEQLESALMQQQPDPEVFRRVWNRVMPDQKDSPLAVVPPPPPPPEPVPPEAAIASMAPEEPSPPPSPEEPAPVPEEEPPLCLGEGARPDTQPLRELMDLAQAGAAAGQALARRGGARSRALLALAEDHRRALRQLSAAYFLITGQRHRPSGPAPNLPGSLPLALREQFAWEQRWERACLQAARRTGDSCLRELYQELAQDGSLHTGVIRSILEQM
ncbi:MAG: rubrerythrin [Lawsonibacter sp.]|nr:rubrerythrin [Lawsonibacter sp.]